MGPPYSGKRLENFVILLNEDNPVCVMNSSAQFCKMSVDYFYEKPRGGHSHDFIVTMFIEGVPVADYMGPKKLLKYLVSERGLQCLNQFCYTVLANKQAINSWSTLTRSVFFWWALYLLAISKAIERKAKCRPLSMQ